MHSLKIVITLFLLLSTVAVNAIESIPTEIVVRVKAKDAKFVGSSIGGALVRIKNADTGAVLAQGITKGSTGDTRLIMKEPKTRYSSITKNAAAFKAMLSIDKPVFLTIEVLAPYIKKQARTLSQTQTWIVPGKPINGEGLIIEVPGMIVDVINPRTHLYSSIDHSPFEIKANVVMMCGCTISKDGLWDGSKMEVAAIVSKGDKPYKTIPLKMQDTVNTFSAWLKPDSPGVYHVSVYAYDPKTGNTGVDQTSFIVTK